jgi:glycine/D-amino acid oxidase-like deaminating enzyme
MAAFAEEVPRPAAAVSYIRNASVGVGDTPYVYVTRRTYEQETGTVTLTCMGGPDADMEDRTYDPTRPVPGDVLDAMDDDILAFAQPARPHGRPYDFQWHGLMGYSDGLVRVVGRHPLHPELLYNLGCNGVGFLPSVFGGERISRILAGDQLRPSIFDPRAD